MSELFAGVDAGGSTTVCVIGDAHGELGRGAAGPANPTLVGVEGFRSALRSAVDAAVGGDRFPSFASAWVGVAGSERPALRAALQAAAAEALMTPSVRVSHDARLVLAAARASSGVAVIAGTGSVAYGLAADGQQALVGGWGHLLGDEGSAYDIARNALRAVTRAVDGRGPRTSLVERMVAATGAGDSRALRDWAYPSRGVEEIAALARHVLQAAEDRDFVAGQIVWRAAADLAEAVVACTRSLALEAPVDVLAAGGLLGEGSPLLRSLTDALARRPSPTAYRVRPLDDEPALGALRLARDPPDDRQLQEERSAAVNSSNGAGGAR